MKELLAGVPEEVTIIDTSNYYPFRDTQIEAIEAGQVESLWVVEQLGRPIVKAWNCIGSDSFANKGMVAGSSDRIALPVAADRERDRQVGLALVEDTGFEAFDAGTLAESWRQQPGAPCIAQTSLLRSYLVRWRQPNGRVCLSGAICRLRQFRNESETAPRIPIQNTPFA